MRKQRLALKPCAGSRGESNFLDGIPAFEHGESSFLDSACAWSARESSFLDGESEHRGTTTRPSRKICSDGVQN
jgi:hypothetical protein